MDEGIARALWVARKEGELCSDALNPGSTAQAYKLQAACSDVAGQSTIGYKIGATSEETLAMLALKDPFYGPLYKEFSVVGQNSAPLPVSVAHNPRIEAEFVVCLKTSLQQGSSRITRQDVSAAVAWVAPGLELVGARAATVGQDSSPGLSAIADFGANAFFMVGEGLHDWQSLSLSSHPVALSIGSGKEGSDDKNVRIDGHSGQSLFGHPFEFVAWLANHADFHRAGLPAGTLISCGTCTGAVPVKPGDVISADYGKLGLLRADCVLA